MASTLVLLLLSFLASVALAPLAFRYSGKVLGLCIRARSTDRRNILLEASQSTEGQTAIHLEKPALRDEDEDGDWEQVGSIELPAVENGKPAGKDWRGVIGFFHPFCNAGGGGERVLWAAIRATRIRYPSAVLVIYTGDHGATKSAILSRVQERFNIDLEPTNLHFLYLSTRHYVLASTWPHFTLLGQSIGSLVLALDAFSLLVPDIFVDTMGYAFAVALSKWLFPDVPTGAYVHYPTISTDMLDSLTPSSTAQDHRGVNAGAGTGAKGLAKRKYWELFAKLYSRMGGEVDAVMTNSSWTQAHIQTLWGSRRKKLRRNNPISVVYPPVAVEELEQEIIVSRDTESNRKPYLLYIAQFRPEKNHELILEAFASFLKESQPPPNPTVPHLLLLGSVRSDADSTRVYNLRLLTHELRLTEHVTFLCDASWPEVLQYLGSSTVGVNGMWNEHFGIGVVEYQAAGLISVVNASGGPKNDIVVDVTGGSTEDGGAGRTGFHASTAAEYQEAFMSAMELPDGEKVKMRLRARRNARRFSEAEFSGKWLDHLAMLVDMRRRKG
ncbi:UDP-Glycosyltransferase/glycogen phosphorylase [Eremomyces bilateralis CBS 781.70]|uniref:GDP-Man:Man(3)GlcNAc(2)-PP-Dol alpha-1,2-mannosyltransferase n=1 Tax=Eremomyces bilateralis CBS 781.70 TaxID=1392243 RepID=A0A6G1FVX4_9PEZI|nr:UDP-Glycosyltransferase/glycogen phosphorylase [Eremomyces bilateralis CBS 781.70]KAF1809934.1 UDP-Glycosyltransferase/glycogen phosphorylase [Eremomyces bilateralis CBS 781.70]